MRCLKCKAIALLDSSCKPAVFPQFVKWEEILHNTFEDLDLSAGRGCELCRIWRRYLIYGATADPESLVTGRTPVHIKKTNRGGWISCGEIEIAFDEDKLNKDDIPGSLPIHPDAAADSNVQLASRWLTNCLRNHPKCGAAGGFSDLAPRLPTRVIDVGPADGSQEPRLVLSSGKTGTYVSLSHCWGLTQHTCKLSHEAVQTWQQGISMSDLPRTFRDAIYITRKLNERYIWIDSLCIIQPIPGDNSDWQREGARMGEIYRNAICNIAASAARDSDAGIFTQRSGAKYPVTPCRLQEDNDNATGLFILPPLPDFTDSVSYAPLNRRAWVLQERMLSPRILHWAPESLFWQCTKTWASESAPDGLIYDDPDDVTGVNILTLTDHRATTWEWAPLIEDYTRRGITNDTDKLPALSGIARIIHLNTGFHYHAGLWQSPVRKLLGEYKSAANLIGAAELSLTAGLMWQSDPTILNNPRRPTSYVAPSWSWASVVGSIHYSDKNTGGPGPMKGWTDVRWRTQADVIHVETNAVADPFGQITAGRVEICSAIRDGFRAVEMPEPALGNARNRPTLDHLERYSNGAYESDVCFDVIAERSIEKFSCLLMSSNIHSHPDSLDWSYSAIALVPCEDGTGTYRRIGWAWLGKSFRGCFDGCERRNFTIV
ncbi:HET-domain-containing protein [Lepidopterella palustris CBS 459.81]|uniref:HET-domain-containing protein n=1 Tax=Lepidopterella palustris CBS 459.81 TaxID=1314670 RepID=A0A8E2JKA8_9PEZI|nr:HET-domain-containing protein [Lepidopterella palustris CBS 459.81]